MRDRVNRNTPIADENINSLPTGRPATERFELWSVEISDKTDNYAEDDAECGCGKKRMDEEERQRRLDAMDEVIQDDLERDR